MTIASPCIQHCCLDAKDVCMGCYRRIEEITIWSESNDQVKKEILDLVKHRKDLYKATKKK